MCCLQTYAATSLMTSKVTLVSCAQLPLRLVLASVQMSLLDGDALQQMVSSDWILLRSVPCLTCCSASMLPSVHRCTSLMRACLSITDCCLAAASRSVGTMSMLPAAISKQRAVLSSPACCGVQTCVQQAQQHLHLVLQTQTPSTARRSLLPAHSFQWTQHAQTSQVKLACFASS